MLIRLILCHLTILAIALSSLPFSQAQTSSINDLTAIINRGERGPSKLMLISSYEDDPFVTESVVESMTSSKFGWEEDERAILRSDQIWIEDEPVVYRKDPKTHQYLEFANNPWPLSPKSNEAGDFRFNDEARFPRHEIERDADGKPLLDENGLQMWKPRDLHRGLTTTFEAVNAAKDAAELWSGRELRWGNDGRLDINAHAFIDFNAFWSPTAKGLFFGVVPHRLPGEPKTAPVKMFELATSWEIAVHESGHALHHAIKPNADLTHAGYRTWTESFGDQLAMWTSLRDSERLGNLLTETNGNLNQSNAITRLGEAFAALIGEGSGMRDAFHDKKVSDTTEEVHDRSEALTGAAYKIFLTVHDWLKSEYGTEESLAKAGQIMGAFLMRVADYTPENQLTLEDVAKAYLKVDKEFFDYRYHNLLVDEFRRREIFDADSQREWLAHEAAIPKLWLHPQWREDKVEQMLEGNLDKLGIGPNFGLKLQSIIYSNRFRGSNAPAQTIVRVQLTRGRGEGATPLDNHGILVFRASGMLAEYHPPLTPEDYAPQLMDVFAQAQALSLLGHAAQLRLDQRGVPLSIVRKADGQLTIESRVMRGEGLNTYMEVFTLDNPRGERREIVVPPLPPDKRIRISDDLLK